MAFQIPLHFEDLTRTTAGTWQVTPSTQREASSDHLLDLLNDDIEPILRSTSPPTPQFNALYTLITRYQNISEAQRRSLVDILVNLARTANSNNPVHLKVVLFHVSGLAVSASNATPPCKFWDKTGQESLLEAAHVLITSAPAPSSFAPADLDQLASQLVRTTLHVLEQPSIVKNKHIRPLLSRCLSSALRLDERQSLPATTALVHTVCRHEHFPGPLADVLHRLLIDNPQLDPFVSEFVREIARIPADRLVQDVAAAKSVANFLSEFSDRYPQVFAANLALLLSLLDVNAYTVRNGIVHVITGLIRHDPNPDDPLLDVLLQRALRDAHAFTRSKALQSWIVLSDAGVVPSRLFPILADMAASRLDDRTAAVRKYAAQLLVTLMKNNPFGPALKLSHFLEKLQEIRADFPDDDEEPVTDLADESVNEDVTNREEQNTGNEQNENTSDNENATSNSGQDESTADQPTSEADSESGDHSESKNDNVDQSPHQAEEAPSPENVLSEEVEEKSAPTEEERAAFIKKRFYKTAVNFIRFLETGLDTMYNMLRSKSITDVAEAVSLLVTVVQFQLEAASGRAVRKMLPLILARETNIRDKAIDAYVRLLAPGGVESVDQKEPAMGVVKGLTALAVGSTMGELACLEELVNALSASRKNCLAITPAVTVVLWDMFSGRVMGTSNEQRRAAGMLVAMVAAKHPDSVAQRVDILSRVGLKDPAYARWSCVALCALPVGSDEDGQVCNHLVDLCKTSNDLSTVEQAINAIFALSHEPENHTEGIIRTLAQDIHSEPEKVGARKLSRFFIVVGHIAVKQLVRVERLVSILRKRVTVTQLDENQEQEEQAIAEADQALEKAQCELLESGSLLHRYGHVARRVAADKNAQAEIRSCAVLCLAKLMCVQKDFCADNLRLLFSILATATEPAIRANAVISLGDLTVRFPNMVEPWSSHIYNSLRDDDVKVRKNTLLVLTHLILNDMIKVKGQIVEMAICVLDKDDRIVDLARLFFHELSRKSANAIYNILPDTISCMSKMDNLSSTGFKTVIGFLMSLMDKEKHADGMVEKLCHRYRSSVSDRENRDLAYCISQLNISSKGLQKLNESFKSYSTAIIDDEVHEMMMQAVAKRNKSAAAGNNALVVQELTSKIESVRRAAGKGEEKTNSSMSACNSLGQNRTSRPISTRRTSSSHTPNDDDDDDDTQESNKTDQQSETQAIGQKKQPRIRGRAKAPTTEAQKSKPKRATRTSRKKIVQSDSESDDEDVDYCDESD